MAYILVIKYATFMKVKLQSSTNHHITAANQVVVNTVYRHITDTGKLGPKTFQHCPDI